MSVIAALTRPPVQLSAVAIFQPRARAASISARARASAITRSHPWAIAGEQR